MHADSSYELTESYDKETMANNIADSHKKRDIARTRETLVHSFYNIEANK